MPSSRPCAAFEPIPPDFDVKNLVETTENFEYVVRIHCDIIDHQGMDNFEKLVLIHVILGGKPLVIEGYDARLDKWTFALQWLRDNCGSKVENARDLTKKTNVPLSIGHYLNHMSLLTNQWTNTNYKDPERQRMYLKDIDCPQLWHDKLQNIIPHNLFYLNESTGDVGGLGATKDPNGKGVAKAGDLMSSLPKEMRAENLMCYIGHEGTYTPAHREMCASLGQNIMVEASTGLVEDGKPTKPGSSIWFMTETKDKAVVSEYWLSKLGHDIEVENHFAQINAWRNAPFMTYVVEQRPGDFILIPPLAPHQVWNRGTRTMKVAWNRTTLETLEMALDEALPRARMVCRDEQYKNKAIVYYTLQKYSKLLRSAEKTKTKRAGKPKSSSELKIRQLEKDFRRLHTLYSQILVSESFGPQEKRVELIPFDSNITCSYCRCNIFNRFLTCPSCVGNLGNGEEDTYDICLDCYVMGRSCACISKLKWVEQFSWSDLIQKHEQWRQQIMGYEIETDKSPMSLKIELERLAGKRTLAQICQLELAKRPWRDITKPQSPRASMEREVEIDVDANRRVKKPKKKARKSEKFIREHARCHVDCHWEPKWKQASCKTCDKSFCYGILFRAYDMKPHEVMADPQWKCPSCLKICGCRHCRHKPGYKAYIPTGTMLGHNTKAVADPRSVESLVDFSYSNISWIQKAGDDNSDDSKQLKKRRREADAAKAQNLELGDDYVESGDLAENDCVEDNLLRLAQHKGIPIDPALAIVSTPTSVGSAGDEDEYDDHPEDARPRHNLPNGAALQPQYFVPEGGIIRDTEHAYELTEAITYDYPDPDSISNAAIALTEDQATPGYQPAETETSGKIEMVERKRKRPRLEEGDRPYHSKQGSHKAKKRQSLVVKLAVSKSRLVEMNTMAFIAQKALKGAFDIPTPVITSDLQALNTSKGGADGQPLPKKMRIEHQVVERDDEFNPGRPRDRRKTAPDGGPGPASDAEITRRQTRMLDMRYKESSEDNDSSDGAETPLYGRLTTKLATMEKAVLIEDSFSHTSDSDSVAASSTIEVAVEEPLPRIGSDATKAVDATGKSDERPRIASSPRPIAQMDGTPSTAHGAHAREFATAPKTLAVHVSRPNPTLVSKPARATALPAPTPRLSSSSSSPPMTSSNKALAQALANRKAKMAAIEWMENDSDSLDDAWPAEEATSAAPPVRLAPQVIVAPPPRPSPQVPKAIKSTTVPTHKVKVMPPTTKPVPQARMPMKEGNKPLKVSIADWADSDSDDDLPPVKRVVTSAGWASINKSGHGHGASANSHRRYVAGRKSLGGGGTAGPGRGRPATTNTTHSRS